MDFNTLLSIFQTPTAPFGVQDILFSISLSFVLSFIIGWVYKDTYKGTTYLQSYVHTLIMMSMVVAVIMLIIGSNIARAFSLVGALSIIRFRNAVKDTRDVGYIFFAMAIGMACGTRFYGVAVVSTVFICFILWSMTKINMFAKDIREQILKVRIASDMSYNHLFDEIFRKYLSSVSLIAMETVQAGMLLELVYHVELKPRVDVQAFLNEIRQKNDNHKVMLIQGIYEFDL
ncbi:MAG: hypothetical protein B6242_07115 [Anaerolineaceae bacterium 4572_78]|nr:MAG: hypothetical protein B6242_07115 [Anaerolineaceae bacterium 4572_78]